MENSQKIASVGLVVVIGLYLFSRVRSDAVPAPPPAPPAAKGATAAPPLSPALLTGGITKLKIEDIKEGSGPAAKAGDELSVNYKGSLLNGEVFDTSYGRAPFSVTLGAHQVIKGWEEGLTGMKAGGKRKLTIPADLGYGAQGSPPKIPGGATLVFEVELISIGKGSAH